MGDLQDIIEEQINKAPRFILIELIVQKLNAEKIIDPQVIAELIADHIIAGNREPFHWDTGDGDSREISLSISEEDLASAANKLDKFLETFPNKIEPITDNISFMMLKSLKKSWKIERKLQISELSEFRDRLEYRWGKPLELLRMLLTVARDFGTAAFKHDPNLEIQGRKNLRDVLLRLHVRACQVTSEIIALIESGYADGAMARWRTLHEIGVVATFISDAGEETAERYIAHQAVEAKVGMSEYERCYKTLGYRPISKRISKMIEHEYIATINRFGSDFSTPYGWAASHLKNKRPTFRDIENKIGRSNMRSYYKLASSNVHAGPHGAFFRLGLFDGTSGLLAGASNAGFTEPGQNTGHSLVQISALLLGEKSDFDQIVTIKVMKSIRDEIAKAFVKADRKLRQDHLAIHSATLKGKAQRREKRL